MRDKIGVSDACYQTVFKSGEVLSIGLAISFVEGETPELDGEMLKRNPQLARNTRIKIKAVDDGEEDQVVPGMRVYHPSETALSNGEQAITFVPWVSWEKTANRKIVFRRRNTNGDPYVLCAREGEEKAFAFDRPENGKYQYIDLDFLFNTERFEPLYIRLINTGDRPSEYFRITAQLCEDNSFPVIRIASVRWDTVPIHLRPRHKQNQG